MKNLGSTCARLFLLYTSPNIRDQSSCGSCWAFGSTEAFNDRRCIATGDTMSMSVEDNHGQLGETARAGVAVVQGHWPRHRRRLHGQMPSTWRMQRLCWSTERRTCRVYYSRSRSGGSWTTRSRRGVEIHSYFDTSRALHKSTPRSPQQQRAVALMLPSSCLDGSVTPVGPGQNPQYTCAVKKTGGCGSPMRTSNTRNHNKWSIN